MSLHLLVYVVDKYADDVSLSQLERDWARRTSTPRQTMENAATPVHHLSSRYFPEINDDASVGVSGSDLRSECGR